MSAKNNCYRKKRMMSIKVKREIIEKHERGVRVNELAKIYDRSTSTICSVLKQKDAIKSAVVADGTTILSQLRTNIHEEMEKLLLVWVKEKELAGHTVTETAICEKARHIYTDLVKKEASTSKDASEESFKASHGWFDNFKKRTGIHSVMRNGESASADVCLESEETEDLNNKSIQFDVEKFIFSVRSRPQLWNKNEPGYGDKVLAEKLWEEIAEEDFKGIINKNKLKTRWRSLKEVLRRELKMVVKRPNRKKKLWPYYNQMLFLIPQVGLINEDGIEYFPGSVKIEEDSNEGMFLEQPVTNFSEGNKVYESENGIENESVIQATYQDPQFDSCERNEDNESENGIENEPVIQATYLDPQFDRSERNQYNEDDYHFAMSIIPYMKQVPMHKKLKMRIAISEVILKETELS